MKRFSALLLVIFLIFGIIKSIPNILNFNPIEFTKEFAQECAQDDKEETTETKQETEEPKVTTDDVDEPPLGQDKYSRLMESYYSHGYIYFKYDFKKDNNLTQNDVKLRQTDSVHFKFVIMNTDRCGSNMAKKSENQIRTAETDISIDTYKAGFNRIYVGELTQEELEQAKYVVTWVTTHYEDTQDSLSFDRNVYYTVEFQNVEQPEYNIGY